ncbi:hypothetical protein TKK_0014127 [Trichogramma kaykai]
MIRRSPTRIDLRLDDLAEYEAMKKEKDTKKSSDKTETCPPPWGGKTTQAEIQERIGYVPGGTPQASHPRANITL